MPTFPKPAILLTDIEGTTTDAAYVHQVLFPYAHDAMEGYVATHGTDPVVQALLNEAACEIEKETGTRPDVAQTVDTLKAWIRQDRKQTQLKAMQGLIWDQGYAKGDFTSHVYPDVLPALQAWHAAGIVLGIYSSGSIHAQQQFFQHTAQGDLTPLFAYYFDTTIGGKKEAQSYRNILQALHHSHAPGQVLFLSDVAEELDAATQAGMAVIQLVRPGTPPCPRHPQVSTFAQIQFAL
jgi:enolase-phosphatase E1